MEIILNNQNFVVENGNFLQDLIDSQLGVKQKGIAVAINNSIVKKEDWAVTKINPLDNILIIKATQGG